MNQIVPLNGQQEYRQSTDAAHLCGDIVKRTATNIQGRKYVSVEGWQAIAVAHGCAAGSRDVEKVEGGIRAIGEVRRMDDGQLIATAEGFVGEDEPTWYGGKNKWGKEQPKRPDYAIRAMAQTRAISRACRSAFAHVVVLIDAGLSTTPAEEVPDGGFLDGHSQDGAVSHQEPADYIPQEPRAGEVKTVESVEYKFPEGPAKNITGLKDMVRRLWREIKGCGDEDELEPLLKTKENKAIIEQCMALENPSHRSQLWEGDGKDNPGLNGLIQQMRDQFAQEQITPAADYLRAG